MLTAKIDEIMMVGLFRYEVSLILSHPYAPKYRIEHINITAWNSRYAWQKMQRLIDNNDFSNSVQDWVSQLEKPYSLDPEVARSMYRIFNPPAYYNEHMQKWTVTLAVVRPLGNKVIVDGNTHCVTGDTAQEAEENAKIAARKAIKEDLDTWLNIVKAHVDSGRPIPE